MNTKSSSLPERISHYNILKKLGAGGMGEVYLAEDTVLERKVAIKFLPPDAAADQQAKKRLIREAQAAGKLDHPNICATYEVSEEAGLNFIVMQYVEGETLATTIKSKRLNLSQCLEIATQVADALVEAHSQGIIHRDVKPNNIMLTVRNQAKVMDFGLAQVVRDNSLVDTEAVTESLLTTPGAIVGTLRYMSPEQLNGEVLDVRSDIFSFGAVLYEMVTGHRPFAAESMAMTMSAVLSREPAPLTLYSRNVPSELERIVSKALRKDRGERYQTARDLLNDLRSLKLHLDSAQESERSLSLYTGDGGEHSTIITRNKAANTSGIAATTVVHKGREIKRRGLIIATAAILVLVFAALSYVYYFPTRSEVIDSIAILPLATAGNDEETEYLSDGLTESLINSLSQFPQLRVVARTTAFRYKGKEIDPTQVGRDLGVKAVLTGRLIQRGETLVMQVDLVETSGGTQIWGAQYNRKASDLLVVRQELAREISERLRLRLTGDDDKRLTKGDAGNAEAYQLYLKGRHFWNKRTGASLKKAMDHFQQAIYKDPNYALAYVGLADCYTLLEQYAGTPTSETLPQARAAIQRALQIDNSLGEAHASLGFIEQNSWNFNEAENEYKRAIELHSNYATAHHWYSLYLRQVRGRIDEAMIEIKRAQQLDPLSPVISHNIAAIQLTKGELDAAIDAEKKVLELDPNFPPAYWALSAAYRRQGRHGEAIAAAEKRVELTGRLSSSLANLALCYVVAGNRAKARSLLRELEERYDRGEVLGQILAPVYAVFGDKERAFACLEKDFQARSGLLTQIAYAAEQDVLRDKLSSDPRWSDLLSRMGLRQN